MTGVDVVVKKAGVTLEKTLKDGCIQVGFPSLVFFVTGCRLLWKFTNSLTGYNDLRFPECVCCKRKAMVVFMLLEICWLFLHFK